MSSATRWTKNRIFTSNSTSQSSSSTGSEFKDSSHPIVVGGPSSPPPAPGLPSSDAALLNVSARNAYHAKPNIELSSNSGQVLLAYPSVAQLWSYSAADCAFCISGSTFGVNGKIITAHFVPSTASNSNSTNNDNKKNNNNEQHSSKNNNNNNNSDKNSSSSRKDSYDDNGLLTRDATRNLVLLQVLRKETIYLEVHQLNKKPSFVQSLVLPPASSGPGPYSIYAKHTTSCVAIITTSGVVTLFSVPEFLPLPLSGLETNLNSEGLPLFDISGRWLAYSPTKLPVPGGSDTSSSAAAAAATAAATSMANGATPGPSASALHTPLKLPPPGQLLDRILENLSTTTASSLKTISDAGVAGIRHYLSSSASPHGGTLADDYAKRKQSNIVLVGNNRFSVDSSGRVAIANTVKDGTLGGIGIVGSSGAALRNATVPAAVVANLPAALSTLFQSHAYSPPVQIIDLETQSPICTFTPPQGISHLSLSPYDSVLATVSARGENIFTFDLSFVPLQVSLSGKYVRGMTPARIFQVEWDSDGGFGIITRDKGSVHWFARQPWNSFEHTTFSPTATPMSPSSSGSGSANSSSVKSSLGSASLGIFANLNKIWKLSGWNIQSMTLIPETIGSEKDPRKRQVGGKNNLPLPSEEDDEDNTDNSNNDNDSNNKFPQNYNFTNFDTNTLDGPKFSKTLMLREGQLLVVDVATGTTAWKYDLPWHPLAENFLTPEIGIEIVKDGEKPSGKVSSKIHVSKPDRRKDLIKMVEPLAFFELEPCLPYPFIHTDRHIILATYEDEEGDNTNNNNDDDNDNDNDPDKCYYPSSMFGVAINSKELDFGRAKGQVQFGTGLESSNGSSTTVQSGSDGGTPLFSDVDEQVLHDFDTNNNNNNGHSNGNNSNGTLNTTSLVPNFGWSTTKAAELELAMQSMVVFDNHEDEDELLIVQ